MRREITESLADAEEAMLSSQFSDGIEAYFWESLGVDRPGNHGNGWGRTVRYTVDSLGRFDHESAPRFDC